MGMWGEWLCCICVWNGAWEPPCIVWWWASSSDTLINPSIFTFPLLPLHCQSTSMHPHTDATAHNRTHTCFIGPISLIWWTHILQFTCFISILSISNMRPPMVWPITNLHTTWSVTFYSFASDEPYALFHVLHLYLTCLYLPFAQKKSYTIAHTSFPQNSDLALTLCITLHPPHTISHCIILPRNPTVFTIYHTWRQSFTSRLHPQSPIGFILRSPAP